MLIKSDCNTITISLDVARALIEFSGDGDAIQLAVGVDASGVLGATDGHSAIRFPITPIHGDLTGLCWSRDHVGMALKVARAQKADVIVLLREQALGPIFPPANQVVPERGISAEPVCIAGNLLARIELAVCAVHGRGRLGRRGVQGAYLVSASPTGPMLWWVLTEEGGAVAAQVVIMPINIPLVGALA